MVLIWIDILNVCMFIVLVFKRAEHTIYYDFTKILLLSETHRRPTCLIRDRYAHRRPTCILWWFFDMSVSVLSPIRYLWWSQIRHVGLQPSMSVSNQACRSTTKHLGLRWVTDKNNIFVHSYILFNVKQLNFFLSVELFNVWKTWFYCLNLNFIFIFSSARMSSPWPCKCTDAA